MGWFTDRIGGRKVISFFCLFLGGGTFLMGKTENLITSAFFYSIVGIGAAATWVPIVTVIQNWFGTKRRGFALGILSPSSGIGFGLMGLILPRIVLQYDWRVCWFVLGISGFLLFFLNGSLLRDQPESMGLLPWGESIHKEEKLLSSSRTMKSLEILKLGRFWVIGTSDLDGGSSHFWFPLWSDLSNVCSLC
jgi:sugar phosphate permease